MTDKIEPSQLPPHPLTPGRPLRRQVISARKKQPKLVGIRTNNQIQSGQEQCRPM